MQIQINTDRHIELDAELRELIESILERSVGRFGARLTRVEVHLTDVNAGKGGKDIRCVMEARPAGMPPVMVDELSRETGTAVRDAAAKLERALDTRIGRAERR